MEVGKARGSETRRRIESIHVHQPWQENKLIDKGIDFYSQEFRLGHLAFDELSASDFYMRKE